MTANVSAVCDDERYPRIKPGIYQARVVNARIYRHPMLRAWKCELAFKLMEGDFTEIRGFFHMGTGERPRAGRHSRFWDACVMAIGRPPRKNQGAHVFV